LRFSIMLTWMSRSNGADAMAAVDLPQWVSVASDASAPASEQARFAFDAAKKIARSLIMIKPDEPAGLCSSTNLR
jgi:hypothetical protein